MGNGGQIFYKATKGNIFYVLREVIMVWKHVSELEKVLLPPSKEHIRKMNKVKIANFSFNKKSYKDDLLQKIQVK